MTQTAIVSRIIDENIAEVYVERISACGDNCASCGAGCSKKNIVYVTAANNVRAQPGEKVTIESSSLKIVSAAALVYILPLIFFLTAYFLAEALKAPENACIFISTGAFFLGCLAVVFINKYVRRDRKLSFEITSIVS